MTAANDLVELAKEAYAIADQLREMQESMEKAGDNVLGYPAFARTYSRHLARAKQILASDSTILGTIQQLGPYDSTLSEGYWTEFCQMMADVPILLSAMRSFATFNLPVKVKERIGFTPKD